MNPVTSAAYYAAWDALSAAQKATLAAQRAQELYGVDNPQALMLLIAASGENVISPPAVIIDLGGLADSDEERADQIRQVADLVESGMTSGHYPRWEYLAETTR